MENNSLIDQIVNDLVDPAKPLSGSLLKTYVLAKRLDNQALINWVNHEMKGYIGDEPIPSYRVAAAQVHGSVTDGRQIWHNRQLPIIGLGEEFVNMLLEHPVTEGVEAMEKNLLSLKGSDKFIGKPIGAEICHDISKNYKYKNVRVTEAWSGVGEPEYNKVYSSIRGYLLELIMNIENELVASGGKEALIQNRDNKSLQNTITNYIHNMNISANGVGNVINTGDNNSFNVNNSVKPGDFSSLRESLLSKGISPEDVNELEILLNQESQRKTTELVPETAGWIGKMVSKSLTGAWQVASGTAANLLAPMITTYLGAHPLHLM
jgi:hypothetical protein